ncbi:secreted protein [Kribbella antiqua]|uniref:Secreted protein n=1 Tax=Kribbella antiqua TaxID=2512217 RepID=A0A4R2IFC3_9ACTN|nr:twin-arginine translocation signal domain-containing protein [Kribbella antiqua]TCO42519.1 secreted protein [Kribbella antiqua]
MSTSPTDPHTDLSPRRPFSRRGFVVTAAATGASLLGGLATSTASAAPKRVVDGIGSVSTAVSA